MSKTDERRIPRDPEDDYTREAAAARREFAARRTGASLEHDDVPRAARRLVR